ncbi:MAG TPA: serine/threonine protein kinase, partial [Mycobacterium sp.]|nr:serine/threonine protein kinase [Mycobacterium sp.]
MLNPGTDFAGYRIERVLGSGGMGMVYLARDRYLPRWDAVKVLSAQLSRDPDFRARFTREADVAAGLSHPNIVSIYDRGETDGQLWI